MKLPAALLRTFTTLHAWVGIVAGFALFVAFYAGAITVFHHDLPVWQSAAAVDARPHTLDDAQRLLDGVLDRHPAARRHVGMLFPGAEAPQSIAYWQQDDGTWLFATLDDLDGSVSPPGGGLAELVNALHYALGFPGVGTWLMGVVSLLYGVAILSGLVVHLPRLAKDFFALRPGRNLKRFWQDAHNVVGVVGLPMHLMFAVTGALLCLVMPVMLVLDPLVYRGGLAQALPQALDTAPLRAAAGAPARTGTLRFWHDRAIEVAREHGEAAFEPAYLKLANARDANGTIEITGASPRALGPLGAVALDAATGELLATQLPRSRDANHATIASAYALHFGEYGNALVPWLYFLLGIGGAFLFYSGNLLWIESRRKRRAAAQGRAQLWMAKATVGACIGLCVAVSAAFVAAQLLEAAGGAVDAGIRVACFAAWSACFAWAALRPPVHAAVELLWCAAAVTAAVAVAHGFATGWWPWASAAAGHWPLFWIDVVALAMAAGFGWLARVTARRARDGEPNSVWAGSRAAG